MDSAWNCAHSNKYVDCGSMGSAWNCAHNNRSVDCGSMGFTWNCAHNNKSMGTVEICVLHGKVLAVITCKSVWAVEVWFLKMMGLQISQKKICIEHSSDSP